ncbi:hypothetical protein GCM10009715_35630 [Paeniglutamicibacter psychrophenolicus]
MLNAGVEHPKALSSLTIRSTTESPEGEFAMAVSDFSVGFPPPSAQTKNRPQSAGDAPASRYGLDRAASGKR